MKSFQIVLAVIGLVFTSQASRAQSVALPVKYSNDQMTVYVGQKVKIFASSTGFPQDQSAGCTAFGLPSGLKIDTFSCTILGTPISSAEVLVRVRNRLNVESPLRLKVESTGVVYPSGRVRAHVGEDIEIVPRLFGIATGQPGRCFSVLMPPGLTVDSTTCAIRGRISGTGKYVAVVRLGFSNDIAISIDVEGAEIVYPANEAQLFVGQAVNLVPEVFAMTRPLSCSGYLLPSGLRLDPATCAITGVPVYPSRSLVTVRSAFGREVALVLNVAAMGIVYPAAKFAIASGRAFNIVPQLIGIPAGQLPFCTALNLPFGLRIDSATCAISGSVLNSTGLNRQVTIQSRFISSQILTLRDGN